MLRYKVYVPKVIVALVIVFQTSELYFGLLWVHHVIGIRANSSGVRIGPTVDRPMCTQYTVAHKLFATTFANLDQIR